MRAADLDERLLEAFGAQLEERDSRVVVEDEVESQHDVIVIQHAGRLVEVQAQAGEDMLQRVDRRHDLFVQVVCVDERELLHEVDLRPHRRH